MKWFWSWIVWLASNGGTLSVGCFKNGKHHLHGLWLQRFCPLAPCVTEVGVAAETIFTASGSSRQIPNSPCNLRSSFSHTFLYSSSKKFSKCSCIYYISPLSVSSCHHNEIFFLTKQLDCLLKLLHCHLNCLLQEDTSDAQSAACSGQLYNGCPVCTWLSTLTPCHHRDNENRRKGPPSLSSALDALSLLRFYFFIPWFLHKERTGYQ